MARHLGDLTWQEFQGAYSALISWLKRANVAGSVADDYSLYAAIEDEWHRARKRKHPRIYARERSQQLFSGAYKLTPFVK